MDKINLYYDFQGWPVQPMTLREILISLGFEEDTETIKLIKGEETNQLLDSYPHLLQDDGMGYGVNERYITEVDNEIYDTEIKGVDTTLHENSKGYTYTVNKTENKIKVFNMFYDKELSDECLRDMIDKYD